ncbi:hypothetical protein Dimus_030516, partial [Dionaea muscipula]
ATAEHKATASGGDDGRREACSSLIVTSTACRYGREPVRRGQIWAEVRRCSKSTE